ncbi:hypothetical protein [Priestia koreensis]
MMDLYKFTPFVLPPVKAIAYPYRLDRNEHSTLYIQLLALASYFLR